ncbi:LOW QUALITY PROTEIN: immunoglobulin-like domain-containing receptor 2 [Sphaeramia orbicularis]|uniref:LOW QUALITY PROTEIN: immunoglobulin-like domain-containing receptor 2 n=1 Tax=Sphaeramia orbicularis TaxID=375764 RepID=UPI00117CAC35|nr:LOW QUALITY PROTEIN: immunoglobulin-like domain-containing receptor 2 [Sphaeramia orbicularis]
MNFYRLVILLGATVCVCDAVHVIVREKQRYAMLFQSVVLPCQYQTASIQTPVVQWWYKSYCRDRTRESFTLPETLGMQASELGPESHLDCSDNSRTIRVVASAQGSSLTLAEHYKGRDITIINKADLRIGELQWGDSGVYFCKVVIADDLEGKNEAQLELLVLGRKGEQDDLLPEFDVEIMPEWAFVGSVVLGSVLFLVLLGICWCQCCPHSCCCYVSCCCCPNTCCCPRHLYEAGKMAKSGQSAQVPVYPYYIPGVPSVVPLAPSTLGEPKITSIPSVNNNLAGVRSGYRLKASPDQDSMKILYYIEKELAQLPSAKMAALQPGSLSELSSLHDGGNTDFRHTYQTVQMKALPPIADIDDQSTLRAPPGRSRRPRQRDRGAHSDDELDNRWNPRSEHLQRKTLGRRGRTGSLDELEEFARSYGSRGRRPDPPDRTYERDYSPPRHFYRDEEYGWGRRSPSPLPQKRRDTWDSDRPSRPAHNRGYDDAYLNSVLENKARGRGGDRGAGRVDEDSDTPSKGSSRGKGSDSYYSRSPSNRPEEDDPLPPYSELEAERYRRAEPPTDRYRTAEPPRTERYRTTEPASRPFSYTRPQQGLSHTIQGREDRDRNRNLSTALSRDSLIV